MKFHIPHYIVMKKIIYLVLFFSISCLNARDIPDNTIIVIGGHSTSVSSTYGFTVITPDGKIKYYPRNISTWPKPEKIIKKDKAYFDDVYNAIIDISKQADSIIRKEQGFKDTFSVKIENKSISLEITLKVNDLEKEYPEIYRIWSDIYTGKST